MVSSKVYDRKGQLFVYLPNYYVERAELKRGDMMTVWMENDGKLWMRKEINAQA